MERFLVKDAHITNGFSLIEILVALVVVMLASLNVISLQKMVGHQSRDNFVHAAVLRLATEKMESVLSKPSLSQLNALQSTIETIRDLQTGTNLQLTWRITKPNPEVGDNSRNIEVQIKWQDSYGKLQHYSYHEEINLGGVPENNSAVILEPIFKSSTQIFFDQKKDYPSGAFVIYNSELFEATTPHCAGNGKPRNISGLHQVSDGWKSEGLVSNPALVNNPDLTSLF